MPPIQDENPSNQNQTSVASPPATPQAQPSAVFTPDKYPLIRKSAILAIVLFAINALVDIGLTLFFDYLGAAFVMLDLVGLFAAIKVKSAASPSQVLIGVRIYMIVILASIIGGFLWAGLAGVGIGILQVVVILWMVQVVQQLHKDGLITSQNFWVAKSNV